MINRIAHVPTGSKPTWASSRAPSGMFAPAKLQELIQPVEKAILNHPGVAIAAAFVIGVTIACLIKRR